MGRVFRMRVTISVLEESGGIVWERYALDENGDVLRFKSIRAAINYLADRNWTIEDLRNVNFNMEEEP
jgi:hypothetical protein